MKKVIEIIPICQVELELPLGMFITKVATGIRIVAAKPELEKIRDRMVLNLQNMLMKYLDYAQEGLILPSDKYNLKIGHVTDNPSIIVEKIKILK